MKQKASNICVNTPEASTDRYWMGDFFARKDHALLSRIPDSYLDDTFNLIGLDKKIKNLEDCYNAITDENESKDFTEECAMYYLLHQRYIYTLTGLEDILAKVLNKEYGSCMRVGCGSPLIPIGLSNELRVSSTKVFCYNCVCVYLPKGSIKSLDGCAWGKYFPHFLVLTFPYKFKKRILPEYVPKIYGFRIYEGEDSNDSLDEDSVCVD